MTVLTTAQLFALALSLAAMTASGIEQNDIPPASPEPASAAQDLSSFYPGENGPKTHMVQSISVSEPAYCSAIKGDVTVTFKAPGMTAVHALCWQQPTATDRSPWGHDVDLAPGLHVDADGNGSFVFHANQFPNGPINLRIYAKGDGNKQDYCELQLFNQGGVVWNQGIPKSKPPAAQDMMLAFADDFDGPLSIATSKDDKSAKYGTHWSGGDGSVWPFSENSGPNNPFSRVETWLRIHDSKPPRTSGFSGNICSTYKGHSGFTVTAPCYFECRLLAQDTIGAWPAFWVLTQGTDPKAGCDEMDIIEGYGTPSNSESGLWSSGYHGTTHFWAQKLPRWAAQTGPDGKRLHPSDGVFDMMHLGGRSSWSATFHTYGLLVTESDTVYYCDNIEVLRHPSGKNARTQPMGFLIDLALGGGSPVDLRR